MPSILQFIFILCPLKQSRLLYMRIAEIFAERWHIMNDVTSHCYRNIGTNKYQYIEYNIGSEQLYSLWCECHIPVFNIGINNYQYLATMVCRSIRMTLTGAS